MPENLQRFTDAQHKDFQIAFTEIKMGLKRSHWMWYIFPQLKGLGLSETAKYYGLENITEAKDFLDHPVLGTNLLLITWELLKLNTNNAASVFGSPDNIKLRSCMTLFSLVQPAKPVFQKVLDKFFDGKQDEQTLRLLSAGKKKI